MDDLVTRSRDTLKAVDDVLDEIGIFTKKCNNWLAGSEFDFAERYIKGDLHLSIRWLSRATNNKYDVFVQRLVARDGNEVLPTLQTKGMNFPSHSSNSNKPVMFINVAKSVEAPKKVVPSSIWLERSNDFLVGGRQLLYFSLNDGLFKFRCIPGEWEVNTLCAGRPIRSGGGTRKNIQRGPELTQCVTNDNSNWIWDRALKSELDRVAGAIGITLTKNAVGITFNEGGNLRGDLINVFLGPGNLQPWLNEQFIHNRTQDEMGPNSVFTDTEVRITTDIDAELSSWFSAA